MNTPILTILALCAFAANSVLCRLALGQEAIDAASFTIVRMISGVLILFLIVALQGKRTFKGTAGSWQSGFMLFLYALTFSFAYISLDTGTGALILFGSVQITMILVSIVSGNRLYPTEWLGVLIAFIGFVYLVLPGVSAPPMAGFLLMTSAGIAWGIYTLRGRESINPLMDTAYNFAYAIPLVIVLFLVTFDTAELTPKGVALSALSGGLASGVGYTIWYAALRGLTSTQAAVVQLSVPVIAAFGGIVIVSEPLTARLAIATLFILGGILVVILSRHPIQSAN
ncbi:MAG: DMT family transporter [Gammaproteobacteria bacterium]|nr:DMT family transporter [Gammaproteobacteria bacterium]